MSVTKEQAAVTYRQLSHKLRWHRAGGPHQESERPWNNADQRIYQDSDDAPTLVTFQEGDDVNIDALLAQGAIQPYTKPKKVTVTAFSDAEPVTVPADTKGGA